MTPARERPSRGRAAREASQTETRTDALAKATDDEAPQPAALKPKAEQASTVDADKPLVEAKAAVEGAPEALPPAVQKAVADAQQSVQRAEAETKRHVELARETTKQNLMLSKKVDWLLKAIGDAGFDLDPQALELFEHRTKGEVEKQAAEMLTKQRSEFEQRQADDDFKRTRADIATKAQKLGLKARDVEVEYALEMQAFLARGGKGTEPTVDSVLKKLRGEQLGKQKAANDAAPSLVAPATTTSVVTAKDKTLNGRLGSLRAAGYDTN